MTRLNLTRVSERLLPGEIRWALHWEATCESTQELARRAALAGAPEGWVIITELQRSGRGRQGRSWEAPAGKALLLSLLLRPPIDVVAKLPLLAGLAVAGGIEAVTGAAPDLKWPNDVLLGDKKVAGLLLERPAGDAVIAGLGVNVNQAVSELPEGATSLAVVLGQPVEREPLLASILNDLANAYERADREGVQWIVPAWRSRSSILGQRISFLRDGVTAAGLAEDIGEDGTLLVRLDDGRSVTLVAGAVERVRRA